MTRSNVATQASAVTCFHREARVRNALFSSVDRASRNCTTHKNHSVEGDQSRSPSARKYASVNFSSLSSQRISSLRGITYVSAGSLPRAKVGPQASSDVVAAHRGAFAGRRPADSLCLRRLRSSRPPVGARAQHHRAHHAGDRFGVASFRCSTSCGAARTPSALPERLPALRPPPDVPGDRSLSAVQWRSGGES